jgi:hypothetical protein
MVRTLRNYINSPEDQHINYHYHESQPDYISKNVVFWDVTLCKSCVNRRFGRIYRLLFQGRKPSNDELMRADG